MQPWGGEAFFAQADGISDSKVVGPARQPDYEQIVATKYGRWTNLGADFAQADDTTGLQAEGPTRQPDYERIVAEKYGRWTNLGADFAQADETADKSCAVAGACP